MNVASLKLCKELFELSGWDNHSEIGDWLPDQNGKYELRGGPWYNQYPRIPAYDLGYLLRKLKEYEVVVSSADDRWQAWHYKGYGSSVQFANTPEDAVCKLAIELFRMPQTPASGGKP